MKKLLFLLLFSPLITQAQKLEGFWGLSFYTSQEKVKALIKTRTGKSPEPTSTRDYLNYKECDFGGNIAYAVKLYFNNDSLYGGDIFYIPEKDPEIVDMYRKIKKDVTKKYGNPDTDVESYKYPYEKGDGHEVTAIKGGYSTIGSLWYFPKGNKETYNGFIMLKIDQDFYIKLVYQDGVLYRRLRDEEEKENQSDY